MHSYIMHVIIKCILRPDVSSAVIAMIYKFHRTVYYNMNVHHDISHDGAKHFNS